MFKSKEKGMKSFKNIIKIWILLMLIPISTNANEMYQYITPQSCQNQSALYYNLVNMYGNAYDSTIREAMHTRCNQYAEEELMQQQVVTPSPTTPAGNDYSAYINAQTCQNKNTLYYTIENDYGNAYSSDISNAINSQCAQYEQAEPTQVSGRLDDGGGYAENPTGVSGRLDDGGGYAENPTGVSGRLDDGGGYAENPTGAGTITGGPDAEVDGGPTHVADAGDLDGEATGPTGGDRTPAGEGDPVGEEVATGPGIETEEVATGVSEGSIDLRAYDDGDPLRLKPEQDEKYFVPALDSESSNRTNLFLHAKVPTICEQETSMPWNEVVASGSAEHMAGSLEYLKREIRAKRFLGDDGQEQSFNVTIPQTTGAEGATPASSEVNDQNFRSARYIIGGAAGQGSVGDRDIKTRVKSYVQTAFLCAAIGSFTGHSSYDGNGGAANSSPTDAYSQCNQAGNQQAQQQCMAQAQQSMGGFQCFKQKDETQDYNACKNLERALTGFYIGQQLHQATQVFRVQDQSMNEQMRMQEQMNSGEGFSNRDAMVTQRNSLEQQRNMATERAAFSTAEAATVTAIAASMPTMQSLKRECLGSKDRLGVLREKVEEILTMPELSEGASTIRESLPDYATLDNEEGIEELCELALGYQGRQLILNTQARGQAQQAMAKAAVDAATNMAQAAMLGKMIDKLDRAINDWEEPEDPNFEEVQLSDTVVSECLVNPELPMCAALQGSQRHGFTSGGINVNTGGPNSLGNGQFEEERGDDGGERKATSSNERQALPGNIGSIAKDNSVANEFVDGDIAAGSVGKGQFKGGGGGGAAGGGGASQPGGAGGRGPAARGGGGKGFAGRGVKVKFGGTGLGSVRARGGKGATGSSRTKGKNPFAKLTKKKGGRAVEFRGPASQVAGKGGNIWSMLSNRYEAVRSKGRLMQYEIKK